MATYLNPNAIKDGSITQEKIDASVLDAKQDSLVSGSNIKTINGQSILGGGDISNLAEKTYVDNSIAKLVDGAPETLDTLNELAVALNDNADILDVLNQSISNKQDTITDLEIIRRGAAKGATALQSYTETDPIYLKDKPNIALKSEIPDISGKANIEDLTEHTGNTNIHVTASDKST